MHKHIVKTILGLSLFVGVAGATPLSNTLTAGLFTFSDITCTGSGCGDITWSATAVSTSAYGGSSSIIFSDNGSTVDLVGSGMSFDYVVTYSGVDPRPGYVAMRVDVNTSTTPDFLGLTPTVIAGGVATFDPLVFNVQEQVGFEPYAGPTSPGTITTTFAAIDSPEPLSLGLSSLAFGMLLIGALRRNAVKRV